MHRNHLIASAAATLEVLEVLGGAARGMPLGDVARAMRRPKGTIHRMLSTLVHTGFVTQDAASGHYALTFKLWHLGAAVVRDLDLVKIARPWLERLVAEGDETVHLAILDASGSVVYVSKVESPRSIRAQTQIGQQRPAWCTATGRAMLAFNPGMAANVLAGNLRPLTPKTVTDPRRLRAIFADVCANGYAVTKSENHPEMAGIAAPIFDHNGNATAACGFAIPAFRMDRALVERCVPLVLRAAGAISSELGHRPAETEANRHAA